MTRPARAHIVTTGFKDIRGNPHATDSALIVEGQLLRARTDTGAALSQVAVTSGAQVSCDNHMLTLATCVPHELKTYRIILQWLFIGRRVGLLVTHDSGRQSRGDRDLLHRGCPGFSVWEASGGAPHHFWKVLRLMIFGALTTPLNVHC